MLDLYTGNEQMDRVTDIQVHDKTSDLNIYNYQQCIVNVYGVIYKDYGGQSHN